MRALLSTLVLLAVPLAAIDAADRVFRLAELGASPATLEYTREVTVPELAKLGFRVGGNLVLEERAGDANVVDALAKELVQLKPDAIVAIGGDAIRAAREATSSIPIVVFGSLPRGEGAPSSLAHPGGNVTGVVILGTALDGKRVQLLHETVPNAHRIAGLFIPWALYRQESERQMREVADRLGLELLAFDAKGPDEYPAAFAAMQAAGAEGLVIMAHADLNRDKVQLAKLAIEKGLPTVCEWLEMAEAGCLLGYGPNQKEMRVSLARYIAQILKGKKPGELPIEQPTRYSFGINLKTAKTLGVTVPQSLLAGADEVIE
jgi:ABC-type uncharacterized transport system substrate-binding protein